MLRILENTSRLFDAHARRGDVAEATPARQSVEDEQRRPAVGQQGASVG